MDREELLSADIYLDLLFEDQVHIWFLDTDEFATDAAIPRWSKVLSQSERAEYSRFLFDQDKDRYLLSRVLLKSCLSHYFPEVDRTDWQFSKNTYGRPSVASPSVCKNFNFNISHSGTCVVCAVSASGQIGVDVEKRDTHIQWLEIGQSFFSELEYQSLVSLDGAQQKAQFLSLWTLKEAFIKAEGLGLYMDLRDFWMLLSDQKIEFGHSSELPVKYAHYYFGQGHFSSRSFDSGCDVAIALGGGGPWNRAPQVSLVKFNGDNMVPCLESFEFRYSSLS